MANDYSIYRKILIAFTIINNPYLLLVDKLGFTRTITYQIYQGIKFIARTKSTDINEAVAILSGKE